MSSTFQNTYGNLNYPYLDPQFTAEGSLPGGPLVGFDSWRNSGTHILSCAPVLRRSPLSDLVWVTREKVGFAPPSPFADGITRRYLSYRVDWESKVFNGVDYDYGASWTLSVLDPETGEYTNTEGGSIDADADGYNHEVVSSSEIELVERWTRYQVDDSIESRLTMTTSVLDEYTTDRMIADALAILADPESEARYRVGPDGLGSIPPYYTVYFDAHPDADLLAEPSSEPEAGALPAILTAYPIAFRRLPTDEASFHVFGGAYALDLPPLLGESTFTLEWDEVFFPFDDPESWSVLASRSFSGSQSDEQTEVYPIEPPDENGWVYVANLRYTALAGTG